MDKKRSFEALKRSMPIDTFDSFCKKVAMQYANSEQHFSIRYFAEMFNLSISCVNNIIEYAIVNNLVEDYIVFKIRDKAIKNQQNKCKGAGSSSEVKYARLFARRCKNIAYNMPEKEVKEITEDIAGNINIPKNEFATIYGMHIKVIDFILLRAIKDSIVDDRNVDLLEARSIANCAIEPGKTDAIHNYFNALRTERKNI